MIETAEEFVMLRDSSNEELYSRSALETASEEVWLEVIDKYPDFREWVAYNKTVPNSILALLAEDEDRRVRSMVAMRRKAGPAILEKLSHDPEESVRMSVAGNAKVPLAILEYLLDDVSWVVRDLAKGRIDKMSQKS